MVAIFLDRSKIRNQMMLLKSGFTITNSHLIVYPFVVSINCPRIRKTQQTKEKVPVIKKIETPDLPSITQSAFYLVYHVHSLRRDGLSEFWQLPLGLFPSIGR
jgi:hypothetical protein